MRTVAITALALALAATARADTAAFDAQMKPLYLEYQKIHKALAADSDKGIDVAAKQIARRAAKLDPSKVSGKHAGHYKGLPQKIKDAAAKLGRAKGIAAKREAFKELSRPFAMWASMSKPEGINVVFCSMAKGSWLQSERTIANPYYGAQMLRCGEVVSGRDQGLKDGHMKGHGH